MTVQRPMSLYVGMGVFGVLLLSLILSTFQWSNQTQKKIIQDLFSLSQDNAFIIYQDAEDLKFHTELTHITSQGSQWETKLPHTPKQPGKFLTNWRHHLIMQGSQSGEIFAISKDTGKILWRTFVPNLTEMSASDYHFPLKHSTLSLNFFFHMNKAEGQLIATQAILGQVLWKTKVKDSLVYAYNTPKYLILRYDKAFELISYQDGKVITSIPFDSELCVTNNIIYFTKNDRLFSYDILSKKTTPIKYSHPLSLSGQCGFYKEKLLLAANTREPLRPLLLTVHQNSVIEGKALSDQSSQIITTINYSNSLPESLPNFLPLILETYQQEQRNRSFLYLSMINLNNKVPEWELRLPSQAKKTLDIAMEWLHPFQFLAKDNHYFLKHNGYLLSLNGRSGQMQAAISIKNWNRQPLMSYHIVNDAIWGFIEDQWFSLNSNTLELLKTGEGKAEIKITNSKQKLKQYRLK